MAVQEHVGRARHRDDASRRRSGPSSSSSSALRRTTRSTSYRLGWIYDFPDAINGLELSGRCDSGNNSTNWCDEDYDALVDEARATPDEDARWEIYAQLEELMFGEDGALPITPIFWYTFTEPRERRGSRHVLHQPTGSDRLHEGRRPGGLAAIGFKDEYGGALRRPATVLLPIGHHTGRQSDVDGGVHHQAALLDDPGDPARHPDDVRDDEADRGEPFRRTERAVPPQVQANLERKFGLDEPWYVQYLLLREEHLHVRPRPVALRAGRDVNDFVNEQLPPLDQARDPRVHLGDPLRPAGRDHRRAETELVLGLRG